MKWRMSTSTGTCDTSPARRVSSSPSDVARGLPRSSSNSRYIISFESYESGTASAASGLGVGVACGGAVGVSTAATVGDGSVGVSTAATVGGGSGAWVGATVTVRSGASPPHAAARTTSAPAVARTAAMNAREIVSMVSLLSFSGNTGSYGPQGSAVDTCHDCPDTRPRHSFSSGHTPMSF